MAQTLGRLTSLGVTRIKTDGMHADGGGLYLQVKGDARSWIFRYRTAGKLRDMGLGSLAAIGLADARRAAESCRTQRAQGVDPIDARDAARAEKKVERAKVVTFAQAQERFIAGRSTGWKNAKHAKQWASTLDTYAGPVIGALPVAAVDTDMVLKILEPIWRTIPETASRVRGRIERVLDWATAHKLRAGENPARWRGHLDNFLAPKSKVRKKKRQPALPYERLPAFLVALRAEQGIGARALELAILTAARSGEVLGMRWAELDEGAKVWTIPAERMKAAREHRVPLTDPALAILAEMRDAFGADGLVFPGAKKGRPLSDMTLTAAIRRMNETAEPKWMDPKQNRTVVPHGFRSTFRDWVADKTNFPGDLAEMALAHALEDETEAAYRRGEMFDKRRRLMAAWAGYATSKLTAEASAAPSVPAAPP